MDRRASIATSPIRPRPAQVGQLGGFAGPRRGHLHVMFPPGVQRNFLLYTRRYAKGFARVGQASAKLAKQL